MDIFSVPLKDENIGNQNAVLLETLKLLNNAITLCAKKKCGWLIYSLVVIFASACGSMPSKKYQIVQSKASESLALPDFIQKTPPAAVLSREAIDFSIDDESSIIKFENRIAPAVLFAMKPYGKQASYLILNSWNHKVNFRDAGYVVPDIFIFDSMRRPVKIPKARVGLEPNCGLRQCLKVGLDISALLGEHYLVLLVPHVSEIDVPVATVNSDTMVAAQGMGILPIIGRFNFYADFYGDFTATFSNELPRALRGN